MTLSPGTARYRDYYSSRPDAEDTDRAFREAPPGEFADCAREQRFVDSTFALIAGMRGSVRGPVAADRVRLDPADARDALSSLAASLGAVLSGTIDSRLDFAYSIRGRGERYGMPVERLLRHTFLIVFEMDREETAQAPRPRQSVEVVKAYLKAAVAANTTAAWIRALGWEAVAHIDGESELVMPPAAEAAGLGELGRHGLLVTRDYGSRVRLSAVTTDLPLIAGVPDSIVRNGLSRFCAGCGNCAAACPAGAIPEAAGESLNHEFCFGQWKRYGTDCGICLAVCPFSG